MTGQDYFLVQVQVPQSEFAAKLDGQRVHAGMPVEVLIQTGERTFLDYLVHPLSRGARAQPERALSAFQESRGAACAPRDRSDGHES